MTRVFIGRLSINARESDVKNFLEGYGKVRDISLKRGYGFVEFDDYRDADDAIADLNGKKLMGERYGFSCYKVNFEMDAVNYS